jgi:hypothetical protein
MQQSYSVSVISGSFERRRNNTGLLHVFTGFLLVLKTMDWVRRIIPEKQWPSFFFLGAGLLFVIFGLFGKRLTMAYSVWSKRFFIVEGICFFTLSILLIPTGKPVDFTFTIIWTLLCGFFYITEKRIEKPAVVTLMDNGILLPGVLKDKLLRWQQIESIVLRTDFLTINQKNNKYFQFEVMEENGKSFLAAFNEYAAKKIAL